MLCTTLSNEHGVSVSTVEHLMAALWGCGIDNIIIELDHQELPIMDGSAEPFVFLLECAGIKELSAAKKIIEITKEISVSEAGASITVKPATDFNITMELDFADKVISKQVSAFSSKSFSFKMDLSRARTFGFVKDVAYLKSIGLAKGASLDNAIGIDDTAILNQHGLRYFDEFAKHKIVDSIGDFYLAGGFIKGNFHSIKSGHALNNKLLHKIFTTKDAYRVLEKSSEQILLLNTYSEMYKCG
jgi:UDP-3-O-[3-hydroxymyristoyl] N-acetylglucosamine deacetylase